MNINHDYYHEYYNEKLDYEFRRYITISGVHNGTLLILYIYIYIYVCIDIV